MMTVEFVHITDDGDGDGNDDDDGPKIMRSEMVTIGDHNRLFILCVVFLPFLLNFFLPVW
jgi:hypothetical protein